MCMNMTFKINVYPTEWSHVDSVPISACLQSEIHSGKDKKIQTVQLFEKNVRFM